MPLALTAVQRHELDVNGFTVMESFFKGEELATLVGGVEDVAFRDWGVETAEQADARNLPTTGQTSAVKAIYSGYNSGIDKVFVDLIDHERILPYVVDSLGWNIHMRDALFTPQRPFGGRGAGATAADPGRLSAAWHFDQEEELTGVTQDGLLPLVDYKVSYYLSDHTEPGHACTLVVPGSHRWTPEQRSSWEDWLDSADVIPLRVPIGTVMLWRSSLLHAVSPHLSASPRYHLYVSYVPRWVRPSFRGVFSTKQHPDPAFNTSLLQQCTPVQRQLLGAMGDLTPTSSSFYWFPQSEQQVPLKQWYEARVLSLTRSGNAAIADEEQETTEKDSEHEVFNGGIMGHGIGFSRILAGLPGLPLDKRLRAASILWAKDSPQYSRMHQGRGYRNMMNTSMYNTPDVIDRQGAWRDIQVPEIEDITALRVQNEALKAKLVELQASASATTSGSKL